MFEFLLLTNFILGIIDLCLLISLLRTSDNNTDLLLDIEKNQRRFSRIFFRRKS